MPGLHKQLKDNYFYVCDSKYPAYKGIISEFDIDDEFEHNDEVECKHGPFGKFGL